MIMARNTFLFSLILLLCFLVFSSTSTKKSIETDESALLAFKSHITLDSNSTHLFSNWTEGTSVCSWIGVGCSSLHHRVVALNVSSLGLEGTIPPHFGNLSFLTSIDISHNNFHGELPQEMAKLKRLRYIRLYINNIGGEIPGWFGSLPNLHYLDLENNSFSGSLPSFLFNATNLEYLSLPQNNLNGHIPEEMGNLKNLRFLNMQYNQIEGSLPLSILNLSSLKIMGFTDNKLNGGLPLDICSKIPNLTGLYISKNQFSGHIDSRFENCSDLQSLSLSYNNFTGVIPREIGNMTRLVELYCGENSFEGEIPPELGYLHNLEELGISDTFVSGQIPPSIFNLSSLSLLSLSSNNLTGSLPRDIGLRLPNLQGIGLYGNRLIGVIPDSISNLTKLAIFQIGPNKFTGAIPISIGNLRFLEIFGVADNFLTTDSFAFLESLTSCKNLIRISIVGNPNIDIQLPPSIGNFSSSLTYFGAQGCGIRGSIPSEIGNLSGLLVLGLGDSLTAVPPPTIQRLSNLQYLALDGNKITGFLPNFLCNMKQLTLLYLGPNGFYGPVPKCFGNMTSLIQLDLHGNKLNSTLPAEIGRLRNLLYLDVSSNFFSGNITTEIGGLYAAIGINLAGNKLSGEIPQSIGGLGYLINLSVSDNKLQGPIPETFKNLISLERLDLSHNNLMGGIPVFLEKIQALNYLNLSFNHFTGRVPSNGSFLNITGNSFMSNDALCGGPPQLNFPLCITDPNKRGSRWKKLRTVAYILIPIATLVFLICTTLFVHLRRQKKAGTLSQVELKSSFERVSFYEIHRATDGFSESNLLGAGSFGSVYRAVLRDGTILAVKVFNQQSERALRSFETECEVISNIRHRNLLKVISSCSNLDFKALVLEYMPNGSLEKWLYSHNHFLNFLQRLNIMVDLAFAVDYLHHGYTTPIVHCDLKPSNVLLDEQMTGHVCDFGISKLLAGDETMVQTITLATIGYAAPEYGSEGLVSTRCDVYSFGVLLMETFTRRKPTDDLFEDGWGLKEMIRDGLKNSTTDFVDQNMMNAEDQQSNKKMKCVVLIMELGLRCAMDSPEQRADVKDVLVELQKIKQLFLSNSA